MRDKSHAFPIHFFFQDAGYLRNRHQLKTFIGFIFRNEKIWPASVNYIFCSDDYLLGINKLFLRHNFFTDILTFNLASGKESVQGEIYISLDRVRENALNLNEYYYKELHRVIFHGILHLCGYTDKTLREKALMTKKENFYLNLYFVPRITVSM